ncbi:MAG TPA: hypothetical protein P5227_12125, partial [Emcibacteraceae bacterium]|nr:hypothetical protein [Emcibacteraceae bacterium]
MILSELQNKRIALWGMGREGKATLEFLQREFPEQKYIIINRDPWDGDETFIPEAELIDHLDQFDVVIKSPGISYYHDAVGKMLAHGIT